MAQQITTTNSPAVRPPRQERSRRLWQRALDTALELLEDGGIEAITISEVCRRARISPPSLYARVDGLAGLIAATFEHSMITVRATESAALATVPGADAPLSARIARLVDAIAGVFESQAAILRPVISASATNPQIHDGGVREARRVQAAMASTLHLPEETADDIAAMIFAAAVVRTVYGLEFTSAQEAEDDATFRARLTRMGLARAQGGAEA